MPLVPDLTAAVGDTPLVELSWLSPRPGVLLFGKCEWFNPGGSVKDRAALAMVEEGEASGRLAPGRTILEATSGNTGIALAWIGAARGYAVEICLPANAGAGRKATLAAYGATVIETDPMLGTDGAIVEARRRAAADPGRYFHPDQYANAANVRAHYETTGPEIWRQAEGRVTHFVAGLGTSGTMMGAGRRLREYDPSIVRVGIQPDVALHGLEGLKHMESALGPSIYDPSRVELQLEGTTEEAHALCRRAAREAGLWIGPSAGAALAGARRIAESPAAARIVVLLSDGGARYADERFWREEAR
jgi:cysteine synthase B